MVVVDHINDNFFHTVLGDKVACTLNDLSQQVCGAEDFMMIGLGSVQIANGFKPQYYTPGHHCQLRGGDLLKNQDTTEKFHHWQPQPQRQH